MPFSRRSCAVSQRPFGRGRVRLHGQAASDQRNFAEDFKLFAATFAAGFLFVSILIG